MIRHLNKSRRYQAPCVKETHVAFESNFCQTVLFKIKVKDLDNMNDEDAFDTSGEYFEDIIS